MLESPELEFIMEAHNGLSAKIVQEAGTSWLIWNFNVGLINKVDMVCLSPVGYGCKHEVCSVIRNERSSTTPNSTPEPRSLFGPRSPSSRRAGARVPPYTPPPLGYRGNPINRTLNIVISVTVALPVSKSDWGASLSHSPAKLRIDLYRTIFHL